MIAVNRVLRRVAGQRAPSPMEMFTQVQNGATPALSSQRAFLLENFRDVLTARGIHEAKLVAMDLKSCNHLLRRLVFERYLAVPLRLFTFDMEFTNIPTFTTEGPTADIVEIGVYSPMRDSRLSILVRSPGDRPMPAATTELTGITNDMLERDGVPFLEAWKQVEAFVATPEPGELPLSNQRCLFLSHGGKLADVSMLQWALKKHHREMPSSFRFGDTFHLIRDAHRRRPVTPDKHPPSWRLGDLVSWLKVETSEAAHRAGDDAKLTWDALFHTLDRYGEDSLTPRQQLVMRFYDSVVKEQIQVGGSTLDAVESLDLDALFSSDSSSVGTSTASSHSTSLMDSPQRNAFTATTTLKRGRKSKDRGIATKESPASLRGSVKVSPRTKSLFDGMEVPSSVMVDAVHDVPDL